MVILEGYAVPIINFTENKIEVITDFVAKLTKFE